MYGFGDDRNPANDTVNVMEEILIEYIVDVVCPFCSGSPTFMFLLLTRCHLVGSDRIREW